MATKTVRHFGSGGVVRTVVTLTNFPVNVNNATAAGVALADGAPLFEFSDGVAAASGGHNIYIKRAHIDVSLSDTTSGSPNSADTPDLGLGTVVGSGAVAVLSTPTTFENVLTGQTMNDCNGTAEVASVATAGVITATQLATDATCFLNIADTWTGIAGKSKIEATGTIIVEWEALEGISS